MTKERAVVPYSAVAVVLSVVLSVMRASSSSLVISIVRSLLAWFSSFIDA